MDARVEQFFLDAQRPLDGKTPKEIDRLRKFLHRNQDHRFTEREQSYLFQAVQYHVTRLGDSGDDDNPAIGLLEDALKMPFTVFGTSHKKSFLKWLDKLTGKGDGSSQHTAAASQAGAAAIYQVIDVTDDMIQVMAPTGDTIDVARQDVEVAWLQQIAAAFESGQDCSVQLNLSDACCPRIAKVCTG